MRARDDFNFVGMRGMLRQRHVERCTRQSSWRTLPHIANNADDGHGVRRIEATQNLLADWIFSGKALSRERLADDGDERAGVLILRVEIAATLQRDIESLEVTG